MIHSPLYFNVHSESWFTFYTSGQNPKVKKMIKLKYIKNLTLLKKYNVDKVSATKFFQYVRTLLQRYMHSTRIKLGWLRILIFRILIFRLLLNQAWVAILEIIIT